MTRIQIEALLMLAAGHARLGYKSEAGARLRLRRSAISANLRKPSQSFLKALRALVVAGRTGLTPGVLNEQLGISPASMSFHLKELKHAGLVTVRREGRSLIYAANFATMTGLIDYLTRHCCAGDPAACGIVSPDAATRKETA